VRERLDEGVGILHFLVHALPVLAAELRAQLAHGAPILGKVVEFGIDVWHEAILQFTLPGSRFPVSASAKATARPRRSASREGGRVQVRFWVLGSGFGVQSSRFAVRCCGGYLGAGGR